MKAQEIGVREWNGARMVNGRTGIVVAKIVIGRPGTGVY